MVVSVNHALDHIRHTLGGGNLSIELDELGILNQAGEYLISMHPWHWLVGRSALINLRTSVSGTTATWTASGNILTETGAFEDYSFVSGDVIEITDGTGATTGFYEVSSRTDDDNIVLSGSISSSNLATGDIEWNIQANSCTLPSDFRDIVDITSTDSTLYDVRQTTLSQLLRYRTSQPFVTGDWNYAVAVSWSGSPPVPILELYPSSQSIQNGAFTIFYRGGWDRVTTDSANIDVPEFIDSLFLRLVRAFARGYEREDSVTMNQLLLEIQQGPEFVMAARRDGMIQPYKSRLTGGGAIVHSRTQNGYRGRASLASFVSAPS